MNYTAAQKAEPQQQRAGSGLCRPSSAFCPSLPVLVLSVFCLVSLLCFSARAGSQELSPSAVCPGCGADRTHLTLNTAEADSCSVYCDLCCGLFTFDHQTVPTGNTCPCCSLPGLCNHSGLYDENGQCTRCRYQCPHRGTYNSNTGVCRKCGHDGGVSPCCLNGHAIASLVRVQGARQCAWRCGESGCFYCSQGTIGFVISHVFGPDHRCLYCGSECVHPESDREGYTCTLCGKSFTVDICEATAADIADQTYTGSALCPGVTLTYEDAALTEITDYTLQYTHNIHAGTARVVITGAGRYTGSMTLYFTIRKAPGEVTRPPQACILSCAEIPQSLITAGSGTGEMCYSRDGESWDTAIPTASSAGSYTVYYKALADTDHEETDTGTVTVIFPGHDYGELIPEVPATCIEDGKKAYYQCSVCDKLFDESKNAVTEDDLVIPAAGHDYGELIPEVPAACTEDGKKAYYQCSVCDELFNENKNAVTEDDLVIPATGHDYGELIPEVPATCTADGKKAYYQCSVCDELFDEDKNAVTEDDLVVPAPGHDYGNMILEVPATCTVDGKKAYYQCSICDALFDEGKNAVTEDDLVILSPGHHTWDMQNGLCTACGTLCPYSTRHGYTSCPECGFHLRVGVVIHYTVSPSAPVTKVYIHEIPAELQQNRGLFTANEEALLRESFDARVCIEVTEAERLTEKQAAALTERLRDRFIPLQFLPVNIRLFRQMEKDPPVQIDLCRPLTVTVRLKPDNIPDGTQGIYILNAREDAEPIPCQYDEFLNEITFTTDTFGLFVILFV